MPTELLIAGLLCARVTTSPQTAAGHTRVLRRALVLSLPLEEGQMREKLQLLTELLGFFSLFISQLEQEDRLL